MVNATNAAEAMAAKLGELPLAIARVGAYTLVTKWSFEAYLEMLESAGVRFLGKPLTGLPANPFSSWETLFDTLTPEAAHLLRPFACLGNEDIPEELLVMGGGEALGWPDAGKVPFPYHLLCVSTIHCPWCLHQEGNKYQSEE